MQLHGNAALSPNQRRGLARRIVDEGWTLTEATVAAEVSVRTTQTWAARYRSEGAGLCDRSCAAKRVHNRTGEQRIEAIAALRRLRFSAIQIAELLEMAETTVSRILRRTGMGRLGCLRLGPRSATSAPDPASSSTSTSRSSGG